MNEKFSKNLNKNTCFTGMSSNYQNLNILETNNC